MKAPVQPNVNDINAPSKNDIEAFVPPKDTTWAADDQARLADWEYMDPEVWQDEAVSRIKKRKELAKALGGKMPGSPAARTEAGVKPKVAFGKAARDSKKGEDFAATVVQNDGLPAAFAIFDGHSGKETARLCSENVCQRLMQAGPPFKPEAITDMLWAIDEEIGTQQIRHRRTV